MLADKAASELGINAEADKMWREVNFGAWENKSWEEIARQDGIAFQAWSRDFVRIAPTEGESFQSLYRRIGFQMDYLKQRPEKKIAVVSHAGAMRAALCYAVGLPLEKAFSIEISYGGSLSLLHESGQWTLYGLNNSD
jgi:broad specificity phosphatase PhoE